MNRRIWSAALLLTALVSTGCTAARTTNPLWAPRSEEYPPDPFSLAIKTSATDVVIGQTLTMEYTLTNTTERAVAGCADGWGDYHLVGTARDKGQATFNADAVRLETVFRVPPRASLVWRTDIVIADVGLGSASLRGSLRSSCSLWAGFVMSEPVMLSVHR
jgi:hypothetical protein